MCFENEESVLIILIMLFLITLADKERFSLVSRGIFTSQLQFLTSLCSEPMIHQEKPSRHPSVPVGP